MKKLLLFIGFGVSFLYGNAQVVLEVLSPSSISSVMANEYVDSTTWVGVPNMENPANAITDTLVLATDSLGCTTITNDLTGKIAVIYRGSCEFGLKAFNAEAAGAIGVIIINPGGSPIPMGAGADGPSVTVPVTMISASDGAALQSQFDAGNDIVVFWGPAFGVNGDDLGFDADSVLVSPAGGVLSTTSLDASEFSIPLGGWVYNYGFNDRTGVTVTADVSLGGSSIYSNTSVAQDILSGERAFFSFPDFSQASYANGDYVISYSISNSVVDEVTTNDSIASTFTINDNYYSLATIDATTGEPSNYSHAQVPVTDAGGFQQSQACVVYRNSNASRVAATGMTFSATKYDPLTPVTLDGDFLEFYAFEWNDAFTDLNDPFWSNAISGLSLNDLAFADFYYSSDDQGVLHTVEFDDPLVLVDDQRYLFCMVSYTDLVQFGIDSRLSYDENVDRELQPTFMMNDGYAWFSNFNFNGNLGVPSMVVNTIPAATVSVDENTVEVTPFPNPTKDIITIPLAGVEGNGSLSIMDLSGKIVSTQSVGVANGNNLTVDVSDLPAGVYVFSMIFDNGTTSTFNVAVTK